MALQTVLTTVDGLDEAIKGLYTEKDGAFVLDISGVDDHPDVKNLKTAYETVKGKHQSAKTAAQEAEDARKTEEAARAQEKGEFESLYNSTLAELSTERESNAAYKGKIEDRDKSSAIGVLAAELTEKGAKQQDIVELYKSYAVISDTGIFFQIGGVTVDADKIKDLVLKERPWLCDGSKANGGGGGGNEQPAQQKAWGEMTATEITELYHKNRPEYDRLKAAQTQ